MGWLKTAFDKGFDLSRVGIVPAYTEFMNFTNKHDDEAGLPQIWQVNANQNIPWLDENKERVETVYSLPDYEGKAIIFVGTAPSLTKSWKHLKGLSDKYVIVATNSSAQFLLERNIYPDYVVLLDGRPGNWTMDLGPKGKNITGIFGACAEPIAMREWPGKIMIVPLGVKDKSINSKIRRRWGNALLAGGNAFNCAVATFAMITKARIFVFVGNDLSFKDTYYADRPSDNDESGYFFATDIHGETVKTLIPLYEYKIWLENLMAQAYPEWYFCNCSDGILGIDVDGEIMGFCDHLPLKKALSQIDEAFEVETRPLDEKLKYMYDQFYDHDMGNLQRGIGMWKYVDTTFNFKKGLDVGCGRANGVQWARKNGLDVYGCDISSGAVKCWKERGVSDYCKVANADKLPYADKEFDLVLCSEVMEHIPEENVPAVLKEMSRVGSDKFLFTISLVPEAIILGGVVQSHICLKPPDWWVDQMAKAGIKYWGGAINKDETGFSVVGVKNVKQYDSGKKKIAKEGDNRNMKVMVLGTPAGVIDDSWESTL